MGNRGRAAAAMQAGTVTRAGLAAGFGIVLLAATALTVRAQDVTVSHAITTFGDPPKYPADFAHFDYVNPDAPKGGEMSQWAFGGFDSMNPFSAKGRGAVGSTIMLESVLTGTMDEIGTAYCLLCETMEYPADRSWVIFNLRPGITFSDGTPLTADDVLFSYETFVSKGLTDFRTVFSQQVEKAEVIDPLKIRFTFKSGIPTRDLPSDVGGLPVFSKAHYLANNLNMEESTLTPYLGSGAYVVDRIEPGTRVVYRRNPAYWGADLALNRGLGNFDTLRYEYFADPQAAFEGFKGGAYTFRVENSSKSWAEQYDFPSAQSGQVQKVEIPNGIKASGQSFVFNLRREKFQDPRVRAAIGLMFNFEWSNQTLFYGLYSRINSVWENSWLAATGTPSPEEVALLQPLVDEGLLPASILTDEAVMAPVSGDRQLDRGNLRKASALLEEAGWPVGEDGKRRNAKGEVLSVSFLNANPQFDRVYTPYVENLIALGIDARLENVDNAQFESRTRDPQYDFDMITDNLRSGYISGSELKQYYGSETADVSVFNVAGLKSKAVDRVIEVVMAAKTMDDLTVATKALDRVIRAEGIWVPQWYKATHWVAYYDMFEHPEKVPEYGLGETMIWWFNPEKAAALKAAGVLK